MGAVFYARRGVTGIDSASMTLALRAYCVSVRTSTEHAYTGAEDEEQKVLPTGMCGSENEVASQSASSAPIGAANRQRFCPAGYVRAASPYTRFW
jgi:hypothetical protein